MKVVARLAILLAIMLVVGTAAGLPGGFAFGAPAGPPADARPGGKLTLAFQYEPVTLDPHVSGQANAFRVLLNIVDGLVYVDQQGNVRPMLAERWRISPNGRIYTFWLRKDVKFHDGTPFNAQAVKFSLDRVMDPATASQSGRIAIGPYEKSEVLDDYTIRITLKEAYAPFLMNLGPGSLAPVSPAAVQRLGRDFGRQPVGTGPFMVKEWVAKSHVTLVRNPNWKWGPLTNKGPAYLDEITIKFVPEDAVRFAVLETNEVQAIEDVPAQNVADIEKNQRLTLYKENFPGSPRQAMINTQRAPTNEVAVRRAILHAVNAEALIRTLYFNAYPVGNGVMSAATPMAIKGQYRQMYPYDQGRARALLEEAGWRPGPDGVRQKAGQRLRVGIYILTDVPAFRPLAEFIQANLKEVGFDAFINAQSRSPWFAALGNGEHHLAPMGLWNADPDMLRALYHSRGSAFSWSHYKNPELDKLVEDGLLYTNPKVRQPYYVKAQEILMRDAVTLPIHEQINLFAIRSQYKGLAFNVNAYPVYYDMYVTR
ncbi:MAG: ABC transporter substrate-binding protein [Armatimonadota bacterium]|nr:ABC transporter substrate-binding protein [Armatimonadota bacterium]